MKPKDLIAGKTILTYPYYKVRSGRKRNYIMAQCPCGTINEFTVSYLKKNKDRILKCGLCYNKKFGLITKNSKL